MQILFEEGFEGDRCPGLGLIKGNIRKMAVLYGHFFIIPLL